MDHTKSAANEGTTVRVAITSPAWPTDFGGFLDMLRDVSAGDFACLHAGSWILSEPDGGLVPIALVGTKPSGERYAVSIVSRISPEAALLRAVWSPPDEAPLTFEELSEAWAWYSADATENDRLNVFLARLRWRKIERTEALWPTSMAFC
jgi:hypothetical protein